MVQIPGRAVLRYSPLAPCVREVDAVRRVLFLGRELDHRRSPARHYAYSVAVVAVTCAFALL
jgi:hypothetical protein